MLLSLSPAGNLAVSWEMMMSVMMVGLMAVLVAVKMAAKKVGWWAGWMAVKRVMSWDTCSVDWIAG